jgi:hypothetical protein
MNDFKNLILWQRFVSLSPSKFTANVEQLIIDAGGLLDRIVETFPTYTLHNSIHAGNVARLMGEILGDSGLKKINALEAAMLLLSAYFHDVGMLFHAKDLKTLSNDPEWKDFINRNHEAFIAVEKARNRIPIEIAEWYCRSRHADRVSLFLNFEPQQLLKWGAVSIRDALGQLCISHNLSVKDLYQLETDYLGECDLRFCAILLRLSDILDFDGSRTPEMVYKFLNLEKRKSSRDAGSDTEWRKHLASNGFKFPPTRTSRFQITIAAGPDDPTVEHDLHKFLDIIDAELQQCGTLLTMCSDRWRDFILPASIDRKGIKANGYKYGDYRFTLEQHQILDLLMGENLYEDPYVFVRELLQNSIDTSRYREFLERSSGNSAFRAEAISVSEWDDCEGCRWVRFDDYGTGMNEQIVEDFLLKVGRSYYTSPQFKAELLKAQKKGSGEFLPISRFGIGLLSCFLSGDRVEIFSVRRTEDGKRDQPVRLSLNGLHGFYTLQVPPLVLAPMPSAAGDEAVPLGRDFGTSIAVRLNPRKEQGVFKLQNELERHLFCPPVRVVFRNADIGGNPRLVEQPWMKRKKIQISSDRFRDFEKKLGYKFRQPFVIDLIPLDLTKHSSSSNLRGQLVVAKHVPSKEWQRLSALPRVLKLDCSVGCHDGRVTLKLEASAGDYDGCKNGTIRDIAEYLEAESDKRDKPRAYDWIDISDLVQGTLPRPCLLGKAPQWLIHNGIVVPTRIPDRSGEDLSWDERLLWFKSASLLSSEGMWGAVYLMDSFRPNISVSRDLLISLPLPVHSQIVLAAFRARRGANRSRHTYPSEVLNHFTAPDGMILGSLLADRLITDENGWRSEPVFRTDAGRMTLEDVRRATAKGGKLQLVNLRTPDWWTKSEFATFMDACVAALAQIGLRIEIERNKFRYGFKTFIAVPGPPTVIQAGHKLFPPLTFLALEDKKVAMNTHGILNVNHRFTQWLLKAAPRLHEKHPGILKSIRRAVIDCSFQGINQNLERLLALRADIGPPTNVFLSESEVETE